MSKIYSNSPNGDFVIIPFLDLLKSSKHAYLAAPFFTQAEPICQAARNGTSIKLLIGLNEVTNLQALQKVHNESGIDVRYLTSQFHAKIFVFDNTALLGSANLTLNGLRVNREAVICLEREKDLESYNNAQALFNDLWETGLAFTESKFLAFSKIHVKLHRKTKINEKKIEMALGTIRPNHIKIGSDEKFSEPAFLTRLRKMVYEDIQVAFEEVKDILVEHNCRRTDLAYLRIEYETNRFLNYVRLTQKNRENGCLSEPLQNQEERFKLIKDYAIEWVGADDNKVPKVFKTWLGNVILTFGSQKAIEDASESQIMNGLMSVHAFYGQNRYFGGGNLPKKFLESNNNDLNRVKSTLIHLLYEPSDFMQRLHDVLKNQSWKLNYFGLSCALELYGTVYPDKFPPINGRMIKGLRFLGFDVNLPS